MKNYPLKKILNSPLTRHPGFAWRKIRKRFGLPECDKRRPVPESLVVKYPSYWKPRLQKWFNACPISKEEYPHTRVFRQTFSENELLQLCRNGPLLGERGLRGDIKLPWEFSRGYAFILNAGRAEDKKKAVACDIAHQIKQWQTATGDSDCCVWVCAMDVAIRAINLVFSDAMLDEELASVFDRSRWAELLWQHGEVIWRTLEVRLFTNSNHYLSNLLGLMVLGQCFPDDRTARRWRTFAEKEFPIALLQQTLSDGALNEKSLPYHALVTEIALLFLLCHENTSSLPKPVLKRIKAMTQITYDFRAATGDVMCIGDDDGGRVVPLDFVMKNNGRAVALRKLAEQLFSVPFSSKKQSFAANAGWWVSRKNKWTVALTIGSETHKSIGAAHSHNDTLAILAERNGHQLLIDPGSYLYTSDISARNEFRSTKKHSVIMVNDEEQNPLTQNPEEIFRLDVRQKTAKVISESQHNIATKWMYLSPSGRKTEIYRSILLINDNLVIRDAWNATTSSSLTWLFHFAPEIGIEDADNGFFLIMPDRERLYLEFRSTAVVKWQVKLGRCAPFYGNCQSSHIIEARVDKPALTGHTELVFTCA